MTLTDKDCMKEFMDIMPNIKVLFPKIVNQGSNVTSNLLIARQAAWVLFKLTEMVKDDNKLYLLSDYTQEESAIKSRSLIDLDNIDLIDNIKKQNLKWDNKFKKGTLNLSVDILIIDENSLIMKVIKYIAMQCSLLYYNYKITIIGIQYNNALTLYDYILGSINRYLRKYVNHYTNNYAEQLTRIVIAIIKEENEFFKKDFVINQQVVTAHGMAVPTLSNIVEIEQDYTFRTIFVLELLDNLRMVALEKKDQDIFSKYHLTLKDKIKKSQHINNYGMAASVENNNDVLTADDISLLGIMIQTSAKLFDKNSVKDETGQSLNSMDSYLTYLASNDADSRLINILRSLVFNGKYGNMTKSFSHTLLSFVRDSLCCPNYHNAQYQLEYYHVHPKYLTELDTIKDDLKQYIQSEKTKPHKVNKEPVVLKQVSFFVEKIINRYNARLSTKDEIKNELNRHLLKSHVAFKINLDDLFLRTFVENCNSLLLLFNNSIVNTYYKNYGDDGKMMQIPEIEEYFNITKNFEEYKEQTLGGIVDKNYSGLNRDDRIKLLNLINYSIVNPNTISYNIQHAAIYNVYPTIYNKFKLGQHSLFNIGLLCAIVAYYGTSNDDLNIIIGGKNQHNPNSTTVTDDQKVKLMKYGEYKDHPQRKQIKELYENDSVKIIIDHFKNATLRCIKEGICINNLDAISNPFTNDEINQIINMQNERNQILYLISFLAFSDLTQRVIQDELEVYYTENTSNYMNKAAYIALTKLAEFKLIHNYNYFDDILAKYYADYYNYFPDNTVNNTEFRTRINSIPNNIIKSILNKGSNIYDTDGLKLIVIPNLNNQYHRQVRMNNSDIDIYLYISEDKTIIVDKTPDKHLATELHLTFKTDENNNTLNEIIKYILKNINDSNYFRYNYLIQKYILPLNKSIEWKKYILDLIEFSNCRNNDILVDKLIESYKLIIMAGPPTLNRIEQIKSESIRLGKYIDNMPSVPKYPIKAFNDYSSYIKSLVLIQLRSNQILNTHLSSSYDDLNYQFDLTLGKMKESIAKLVSGVKSTYQSSTNSGTHNIELCELIDNETLINSTVSRNNYMMLALLRSFIGSTSQVIKYSHNVSGLEFYNDPTGILLLKNQDRKIIDVHRQIIKKNTKLCKAFGESSTDFGNDTSINLYINCLNPEGHNDDQCRVIFKKLKNLQDINAWANLDPIKKKYVAYRILFGLKLNGIPGDGIISFVINGDTYLSTNEIIDKLELTKDDPLVEKQVNYIKTLMKTADIIRFQSETKTVNNKVKFQSFKYKVTMSKSTMSKSIDINQQLPILSGGNLNQIPILYGGNIYANIKDLVMPIKKKLNTIINNNIKIKPKRILEIYSYLSEILMLAHELEYSENKIAIYNELITKSPNNQYVTDLDFEDELDRREKIASKMANKINSTVKLDQILLEFIN